MAPTGRYFQLVSKLSGHALGVASGGANPSAPVVTCERSKEEAGDEQVWYEDKSTGTIRIKANGLCLHVTDDNSLRLHPFEAGHSGQRWTFKDGRVQQGDDPEKVLDISGASKDPGASICVWSYHGADNQLWEQVFLNPKFFYLKSELSGRVLDIEGDSADAGARLCIWDQKPVPSAANQLWYEDRNGIIRSRLNDFLLDSTDPKELVMRPFDGGRAASQSWVLNGGYVALQPTKTTVLDIIGSNPENGAMICAYDAHGKPNQKWSVEFAA